MTTLRAEQLEAHLARTLAPLYTIHGDEPLLALEAADAIRARARAAGYTERDVLLAERGFNWNALGHSGASLSLFGERRLIELRIPGGRPGSDGAAAIGAWCGRLAPDTLTLVSLPRLDRAGQDSTWFRALERAGVLVNVLAVERVKLPEWIARRLERQRQRADPDTLRFLADAVEGNLLAAHQEIRKLALLCPEGELSFETVREAVMNVARYDPSRLGEAMLAGDAARFARMLDGIRGEGEAAPRVLWFIAEEIRALGRLRAGLAAGEDPARLLRANRIWGEAHQSLAMRAARRCDETFIGQALVHAAEADRIAKGVAPGDVWDTLLQLGLRFAAPGAPA